MQPPAIKRRRIYSQVGDTIQHRSVPRILSKNIRHNSDLDDAEKNPLINIHKKKPIPDFIASIRLYSMIKTFCIGKESKSGKQIHITSQSPFSGLCSKHIEMALTANGYSPRLLPSLSFCLMNFSCGCFMNPNASTITYGIHSTFVIPDRFINYISNSNYPSTVISIEINDETVGYFFVKTAAPSNLKRMAQPSTFSQFRMSISKSVQMRSKKYDGLEIFIKSSTDSNEYGVGIGYYFTARSPNIVDIVCCVTNVQDTQFVIRCDGNISKNIRSIGCKMHTEGSSDAFSLFEYRKRKGRIANNYCNHNGNSHPRNVNNNYPKLSNLLNIPYVAPPHIQPMEMPLVPYSYVAVRGQAPQRMYVIHNNIAYQLV